MKTREIRQLFLNYFKSKGHVVVPSSSLVPQDDPSLLFTSAGMVQFKKIFLGQEIIPYKRATSCQKCLRAGGKHNDLENVGFTSRHHTFFEMLGNFSFGDYFKREAIFYAWEFITMYLKIAPEKLWITVYKDDIESENIWLKEIGVDANRLSRCDENENFWAMGDTGPCGPCTEIYYDHGANFVGEPPGFGEPGERYIEIYNLVFMQYNRTIDGVLHALPKQCVDTGMGLERITTIMQSVHSNYEIDIFVNLIKGIAKLLNITDLTHTSLRVIADHLRAAVFLVTDGVVPTNEGRGYVLRRIMRRAIRHGYKLGHNQPFFYLLVNNLINVMGEDFAELHGQASRIEKIFLAEEQQFAKTLEHGMVLLQQAINQAVNNTIQGAIIFKLYDTYGFPVDLIRDVAKENKMVLDMDGFEKEMLQQKTRARQINKFHDLNIELDHLAETKFCGYEQNSNQAKILQIFDYNSNKALDSLSIGATAKIILDITPFYAESGGQVGDQGVLLIPNKNIKFIVTDTQKIGNLYIIHIGKLESGVLTVGDTVFAEIDVDRQQKIRLNHSATHLLQAALKSVLGDHVKQKGSVVDDKKLRFDFEHFQALTNFELMNVQRLVNEKIRDNIVTTTEVMPIEAAIAKGATALFTEKYQDEVRVLNIANGFSIELCGGSHVNRSGDIGLFKIISEEAIASGVRRIEAVTGQQAINYVENNQAAIQETLKLLRISDLNLIKANIEKLIFENKELEKSLDLMEKKNLNIQIENLIHQVKNTEQGIKILTSIVNINPRHLKIAIDQLKQSVGTGIIILGCEYNAKAMLIVGVTKDIATKYSAVELIKYIATFIDGNGGGRQDLAEASGNNCKKLKEALSAGYNKILEIL